MVLGLIFPSVCKVLLCLKYRVTVTLLSRVEERFWVLLAKEFNISHLYSTRV